MWDLAEAPSTGIHLSHDLPCLKCGHAAHQYLSCSDTCACVPPPTPGSVRATTTTCSRPPDMLATEVVGVAHRSEAIARARAVGLGG